MKFSIFCSLYILGPAIAAPQYGSDSPSASLKGSEHYRGPYPDPYPGPYPGPPPGAEYGGERLATFDDLPAFSRNGQAYPVYVYKGINFNSFYVASTTFQGYNIINPESPPNSAFAGVNEEFVPTLTSIYDNSKIASFDLQNMYFACATINRSRVSVPEQCTISFTAHKTDEGAAFDTLDATFVPTNDQSSNMRQVVFPDNWTDLVRVRMVIIESTGDFAYSSIFIDNVAFRTNGC